MRLLVRLFVALAGLVALALVAGVLYVDALARLALEEAGRLALGVETRVESVSLGFRGLTVRGLLFANPEGFETPHFLRVRELRCALDPASLRRSPVVLPGVTLEGIDLRLERRAGRTNYGAILAHVESLGSKGGGESSAPAVRVEELRMREIHARARLLPLAGEGAELDVEVPEIRLDDPAAGPNGTELPRLLGMVVQALLEAVVRKGETLPPDLAGDLARNLRASRVRWAFDGGAERAGEALREGSRRLGEGLQGLLGGSKKREP